MRSDWFRGTLATILFRVFCLPVSSPVTLRLKYIRLYFYLLCYTGVHLRLFHLRKNIDSGCLRTGCWGECLDLRGGKWRLAGKDWIMRSFTTCKLQQILLGWSSQGGWDGIGWVGHLARTEEMRNAYNILVGKSEGERPLGMSYEDNIRMDLREICWEVVDWMHLAQDSDKWWALVNTVMNLRIP